MPPARSIIFSALLFSVMQSLSAGELLSRHFDPRGDALFVGGFTGPESDPSILWACNRAYGYKGNVWVLDAKSGSFLRKLIKVITEPTSAEAGAFRLRQKQGSSKSESRLGLSPQALLDRFKEFKGLEGHGDPVSYRELLQKTFSNIHWLKSPKIWLADAVNTKFRGGGGRQNLNAKTSHRLNSKRFRLVVDAGTACFAARSHGITQTDHTKAGWFYPKLVAEYKRVAAKAVFLLDDNDFKEHAVFLRRALEQAGGELEEHLITPSYSIPTKNHGVRLYEHYHPYGRAWVVNFPKPPNKARVESSPKNRLGSSLARK